MASATASGGRPAARVAGLAPGVVLCVAITIVARVLQGAEERIIGHPYIEAIVLAILVGTAVRTVWTPGARWRPGIDASSKLLLETAVVLLGASVSFQTVVAAGYGLLIGIVTIVAISIPASYSISRALGLPRRLSMLIACGNSICGNSAIAAVAPVIGADGDDIAASIAFTAILGVVAVLGLPLLIPVLGLTLPQYGILAGLTVYAVPQVLAATMPVSLLSAQMGTLVKLVRVLMLGPVVVGLSLQRGVRHGHPREGTRRPPLHRLVPWFMLGFTALLTLRSAGAIPSVALGPLARTATLLTVISMAALGLGVDVRSVARVGPRVTAAVTASLVVLVTISAVLIRLLAGR